MEPSYALVYALLLLVCPQAWAQQSWQGYYQEGKAAQAAGDFEAASEHFQRAHEHAPNNPTVLFAHGLVLGYQGRYAEALAALSRARELAPRDLDILLALARLSGWQGRFAEVDEYIQEVLFQDPDHVEALALKARTLYWRREYNEAADLYERVLKLAAAADLYSVLLESGDVAVAARDWERAESYYQQARAIQSDSADLATRLRRLRTLMRNWEVRYNRKLWIEGVRQVAYPSN